MIWPFYFSDLTSLNSLQLCWPLCLTLNTPGTLPSQVFTLALPYVWKPLTPESHVGPLFAALGPCSPASRPHSRITSLLPLPPSAASLCQSLPDGLFGPWRKGLCLYRSVRLDGGARLIHDALLLRVHTSHSIGSSLCRVMENLRRLQG